MADTTPLLEAGEGLQQEEPASLKPLPKLHSPPRTFTTSNVWLVWLLGPILIGAAIGFAAPTEGEPCSGLPPVLER